MFYKKNSCPNIITNNLKKTASEIIKKGPFLKKLLKVPCKSESKLLRQNKRLVNKTNISGFSNIKTKPIEKTNKTFDFPSKDEEKLYDIINQEYQTLFNVKTTKSLQNNILPNIEDYLKTVKNFRSEKLKQKSEKIQVKCSEISKRLEKNLHLLKINFDQKKNQQIELKKENACQKIQKTWRNYRQKHQKTFKNVLNICHTSLYQKNRAKLLQKRVFSPSTLKKNLLENRKSLEKKFLTSKNVLLNKNDSHTLKLSHKWKDLRENNHKLIPKLKIDVTKLRLSRNNIESLRLSQNLDSFSSSKIKHSINTTLNFKEINENSKSLITIHDFNSKSIEREDLSKITSSIHEKNNRNPNKSQDVSFEPIMKKDSVYEKIKEENSESHSENEVIKIAEIVDLAELSKQYQDELDLVKENYLKQLNNKEVNQAAEKFFSLIQKQSDLNKRILFENSKLTKAISNIREDSPLTSTFYPNPNSESLPNDPKISVKSNLSDLRAAFGSEKLLKEASSSIGLQNTEKDKEGQKIFEEDSFRNFTNRKILEFLKKENLKEILKIRENPSKRKTRNHDLQKKREKKGFEIEKWVSKENSKQKIKKKSVESLGFDLPKVIIFS